MRLRRNQGETRVHKTAQYSTFLGLQPARTLGQHPRAVTLVREVAITHNGQLCFYARTLMPKSSLVGELRRLPTWQNRSLGDFLFRQPQPQMSELEFARLTFHGEPVWARRRCHYLYNRSIMVCEFFPDSSRCQWMP